MGTVIAIIAVVVVVAIVVGVVVMRRRSASTPAPTPDPPPAPRTPRPEPAPMTGLEEALNKATDRSGSTMADRLDAEQGHLDELRQTDDTGPLLRRALDSVDRGQDSPVEGDTAPAADDAADAPRPDGPDAERP